MKNTGGISQEAVDFLKASENMETIAPDRNDIIAYRKYASDEFRPRAERALKKHKVQTNDIVIGGVPCLEILPENGEPKGTILYGYGGGFVCGSSYEDLIITAPICEMSEMRIISPNYRLAPEHPWPTAIDDGFSVYQEIAKQGAFALMGESAGGNFALALCHRAKASGLQMPSKMVLLPLRCCLYQKYTHWWR